MDQSNPLSMVSVRMSIGVGFTTVCGPSGVSDTESTSMFHVRTGSQLLETVASISNFLGVLRNH